MQTLKTDIYINTKLNSNLNSFNSKVTQQTIILKDTFWGQTSEPKREESNAFIDWQV